MSTRAPITTLTDLQEPFKAATFFSVLPSTQIFVNDAALTDAPTLSLAPGGVALFTGWSIGTPTTLSFSWNQNANQIHYSFVLPAGAQGSSSSFAFAPTTPTSVADTSTKQSATSNPTTNTQAPTSSLPASGSSDTTPPSTAISSSQSATGSSSPSRSNNGLPGGAVAGVAIGCLLAGALIAGLFAFFFLKKKRHGGVRDSEASSMALIHREKGPVVGARSLESRSPIAGALEASLPLPLEDKAISGEISKISNLIKNHVQSYYHAGRVSPVLIDYDDLQALGDDMPVSVGTLSTLLGNSATREIALRFCIAWIVVSRMQLRSPPSTTLLPPEVSQCFQAMDLANRGPKVHATYFSRWRAITAELMQSAYVRNPFSASDTRLHNLRLASTLLNNILRPYSDSRMDDGQRSHNLEEILKRSALFAFTLFSQPSTWEFDWDNGQDVKSGSLCIFPALLQVKDENGEIVKPARPFNEAVIRRLDE